MNTENRFWSKVSIRTVEECWEWKGCLSKGNRGGYGEFKHNGRVYKSHRMAWMLINGEIPDGLLVCHKCDNRKCCNPNHLFLGTVQDNNLDRNTKGRTGSSKGESHPLHKLSTQDVLEIQNSSLSQRKLASIYGVGQSHIQRVKTKQVWKHVS